MRTRRANGTSLTEVLIASVVFAILIILLMGVFASTERSRFSTSVGSDLATRGRMTIDLLRSELSVAKLSFIHTDPTITGGVFGSGTGTLNDGTLIRYQLPVGINANGSQRYGCIISNPDTPIDGGYVELRYVVQLILRENAGPTVTLTSINTDPQIAPTTRTFDRDITGDGDLDDAYVLGRLMTYLVNSDLAATVLTTTPIDDFILLRVRPGTTGTLDGPIIGNSGDDPLFTILDATDIEVENTDIKNSARKVRVNLWHGQFDQNERILLKVRNIEGIRLANPQ